MTKQYVVTAPYVTLKVRDLAGNMVLGEFYQGATVPDSADPDDVARLSGKGMLGEKQKQAWAGPPADDATAKVPEPAPAPAEDGTRPQRPGDSASKAAWVNYAVALREEGVSEEDARTQAEEMTKDDLITLHEPTTAEPATPQPAPEPAAENPAQAQEPQRPADSASKAAWVEYAVASREDGVSAQDARAAAEAMTKADLITVHGQ